MLCWQSVRRRRASKGVESSFTPLRSSFRPLIFFWCTLKVPFCIDDGVEFEENHVLLQILYFLVIWSDFWLCLLIEMLLLDLKKEDISILFLFQTSVVCHTPLVHNLYLLCCFFFWKIRGIAHLTSQTHLVLKQIGSNCVY